MVCWELAIYYIILQMKMHHIEHHYKQWNMNMPLLLPPLMRTETASFEMDMCNFDQSLSVAFVHFYLKNSIALIICCINKVFKYI